MMKLTGILLVLTILTFFIAGCGSGGGGGGSSSASSGTPAGGTNPPPATTPPPPATTPSTLSGKLYALDGIGGEAFGYSVSINGDYVIAGAPVDDEKGSNAGAAYIFKRTAPDTWDTGYKLTASDAADNDYFGWSVAISGDYAIVGARYQDAGGTDRGAAYIFQRTGPGNAWDSGTKIIASSQEDLAYFGQSVAIDGDYVIVGALSENGAGNNRGAAYIFYRTGPGNAWDAGTRITAFDAENSDNFGYAVAISGDYVIAGATLEGTASDNTPGAAYIFSRTGPGNVWDTGYKLTAQEAKHLDMFGTSVSISGDYAIVGAYADDFTMNATDYINAGSAYIFYRTGPGNVWDAGTTIRPFDPESGLNNPDNFGWSVAISGNTAVVGSINEDDRGSNAGALYKFTRTGQNDWDTGTKAYAYDSGIQEQFGSSVAMSGSDIIAGSYLKDGKGAAYLFNSTDIQ